MSKKKKPSKKKITREMLEQKFLQENYAFLEYFGNEDIPLDNKLTYANTRIHESIGVYLAKIRDCEARREEAAARREEAKLKAKQQDPNQPLDLKLDMIIDDDEEQPPAVEGAA